MRQTILFLSFLLHIAPSWAGGDSAREMTTYEPLAAHYREEIVVGKKQKSADWYFTRHDNQVETAQAGYAEAWQRDERGEIALTRVFHQDRKLIQYTPGELRTQGRQKNWFALNSIVDPRQHAALRRVGSVSVLGRPASRYTGKIDGERIEVIWLTQEALAAKVVRAGRDGRVSLELKELRSSPDSRWPRADLADTDQYTFLDGADLGDMEYDPFVQRVLDAESGHGAHIHHPTDTAGQ